MKKLAAILIAAVLAGCGPSELKVSSQGKQVYATNYGSDICYDGVVYVMFGSGSNASWGGAKFDKTTKQPVTC